MGFSEASYDAIFGSEWSFREDGWDGQGGADIATGIGCEGREGKGMFLFCGFDHEAGVLGLLTGGQEVTG